MLVLLPAYFFSPSMSTTRSGCSFFFHHCSGVYAIQTQIGDTAKLSRAKKQAKRWWYVPLRVAVSQLSPLNGMQGWQSPDTQQQMQWSQPHNQLWTPDSQPNSGMMNVTPPMSPAVLPMMPGNQPQQSLPLSPTNQVRVSPQVDCSGVVSCTQTCPMGAACSNSRPPPLQTPPKFSNPSVSNFWGRRKFFPEGVFFLTPDLT